MANANNGAAKEYQLMFGPPVERPKPPKDLAELADHLQRVRRSTYKLPVWFLRLMHDAKEPVTFDEMIDKVYIAHDLDAPEDVLYVCREANKEINHYMIRCRIEQCGETFVRIDMSE
jgi:hypothetical protein